MANTYTLIASNMLSSSAASVTFSAIPSTYTDLVLRMSARTAAGSGIAYTVETKFNSNSSNYSYTAILNTNSTTVGSWRSSADTYGTWLYSSDTPDSTANTFSSAEMYIPSYASSSNKVFSTVSAPETNDAVDYLLTTTANLWQNTTAISSITLTPPASFAAGSSFYLYGIKNS